MSAVTIEVPIHRLPDGREFITERDVVECTALRAFIDRFSNYWTYDFQRQGWVSPLNPNGEA